jgi:hypothetical protein
LLLNEFKAKKQFSSGIIEGLIKESLRLYELPDRQALSTSRAWQAPGAKTGPQILLTKRISYPPAAW